MRRFKIVTLLLLTVSIFCCKNDDAIKGTSCKKRTANIGDFQLLDESIAAIAYYDHDSVYFKDSIGNELKLTMSSTPLRDTETSQITKYNVDSDCDTVIYKYSSQFRFNYLINEVAKIRFNCSLESSGYYSNPESGDVADVYRILMQYPDAPGTYSQVFGITINQRTWPSDFNNRKLGSIEIFGKTFKNVEKPAFQHPLSTILYNKEFGIVSFTDNYNKKWIFDRFE